MSFKKPKIIFSDFDGTMTDDHRLTRTFFDIIELLERNKIPLVIVTGRPKSWGHFLMSHFPYLAHAITEGGGVISYRDTNGRIAEKTYIEKIDVERLEALTSQLQLKFPEVSLSIDSAARQTDRAIELSWLQENKSQWSEIEHFLSEAKANYSTSNIHLNFWCGEISKSNSMNRYLAEYNNISPEECLFFGDSLNDETAFRDFPHTVGVANIENVMDQLKTLPAVVMEGKHHEGPRGVMAYLAQFFD